MHRKIMSLSAAGTLVALTLAACGDNATKTAREGGAATTPVTAEDKRARGDALVKQMGDKLRSAQALSFTTTEASDRVRRNNEKVTVNVNRQVAARRPDRMWFKTTGDRDLECFYDGQRVTLVSHKDKVFGQFNAAPTLDETTDLMTSRYDVALPVADLLASNPHEVLLDGKTTGGWEKRESVDGVECNVVAYQHPNVDFSVWIPAAGDPLPKKLQITYKARRGQPSTTMLFKDWNLSPQVSDDRFALKVPEDYEGIPVIQRASAVIPEAGSAEGDAAKKGAAQTPTPAAKK